MDAIRIVYLIFIHLLADVVFQGNKMDELKHRRLMYLLVHGGIYTLVLAVATQFTLMVGLTPILALKFAVFNGLMHFVVDFFTGGWKETAWCKKSNNNLLIVTVADHFIHLAILFISYDYLLDGRILLGGKLIF